MELSYMTLAADTDYQELKELLELITKAGLRCSYDLLHAAADQRSPDKSNFYNSRAHYWATIFNPADGGTDYRHDLHRRISYLENELRNRTLKYKALLAEHEITDTVIGDEVDEAPF